ncbi:EAL domain, c-di-GMP-specific phosphodiesterase class I (or its enzymatically inactive variant) [Ruminococcaceae bacterium FB2012]|nr:EAL domain, c-di-GMP-specific phosphodiesterase class I (or its enzymatically inactive variant) [Ruminococcaceae bacterium FB2012]
MYREKLTALGEFVSAAEKLKNSDQLEKLIGECLTQLGDLDGEREISILADKLFRLSRRLVGMRSDNEAVRRLAELSLEERIELEQVEHIIEGNLLCYHFQPIVSAVDGSVYSYEALMRPVGSPLISPFHILKYAALTERLQDIEKATFMNVLKLIDTEPERFYGKPVFINSIPNIVLPPEDSNMIAELLVRNADRAVIEMTERGELDERKFDYLRKRYRTVNVRIAIDDYGTGYSNVKNLLSYMPDYVKIDRSLLSEIQNSQKKRHFVRDIIEFCHDNGILALAEGVETSEELRAVILMGIDLIQGFYTGRPVPDPVETINDEIVAEIRRCRAELTDGIASKQYVASAGERVLLEKVLRDGCASVLVGKDIPKGGKVTVAGTPQNETAIAVLVSKEFSGTLIIENVNLVSLKNAPCISLADGSDVKLQIAGECHFMGGGIKVPRKARLEVVGKGAVVMHLDDSDYFGFGNDMGSQNGDIIMSHDCMIYIEANGQSGVGIGSGRGGGKIEINSGKYLISQRGGYGVSIGTLNEPVRIDIQNCDLETKLSSAKGTSVGSLHSRAEISIRRSSFRCFAGGLTVSALGTVDGSGANILVNNSNVTLDVRADELTAVGALNGTSEIDISKASFMIAAGGVNALAFGGAGHPTSLSISNADVGVELTTEVENGFCADREGIRISGGRCIFTVNGKTEEY